MREPDLPPEDASEKPDFPPRNTSVSSEQVEEPKPVPAAQLVEEIIKEMEAEEAAAQEPKSEPEPEAYENMFPLRMKAPSPRTTEFVFENVIFTPNTDPDSRITLSPSETELPAFLTSSDLESKQITTLRRKYLQPSETPTAEAQFTPTAPETTVASENCVEENIQCDTETEPPVQGIPEEPIIDQELMDSPLSALHYLAAVNPDFFEDQHSNPAKESSPEPTDDVTVTERRVLKRPLDSTSPDEEQAVKKVVLGIKTFHPKSRKPAVAVMSFGILPKREWRPSSPYRALPPGALLHTEPTPPPEPKKKAPVSPLAAPPSDSESTPRPNTSQNGSASRSPVKVRKSFNSLSTFS